MKASKVVRSFAIVIVLALAAMATQAQNWVGSWASSQQLVEPRNSIVETDLKDVTLRQIVHMTIGGDELRLHLSNRYGTGPLHISSVHVGRAASPASSAIAPGSDQALTFSSTHDVTIPQGADYLSDPFKFPAAALSDVAITIYIDTIPTAQTGHPGSRATSYLVHGDHASDTDLHEPTKIEHWYFIEGIDVQESPTATAVVTLGDSITDGHGATTNGNDRWPDDLARRLQAAGGGPMVSVLNHGIGGNRVLLDSIGPNALARFNEDVIAQAGVRYLLVLEGVNDIGMLNRSENPTAKDHERLVHEIIAGYEQMIERAHTHGIRVAGCTILPFVGTEFYHPGAESEGDRQAINKWIRTSGEFDAVIDFDKVTRDPEHPDRLLPKFDSGDHLHPSPAGFAAMAESVPLDFFVHVQVRRQRKK